MPSTCARPRAPSSNHHTRMRATEQKPGNPNPHSPSTQKHSPNTHMHTHTRAHTSKRRGMPRQPHVGHAGVLGHDRSPDLGSARGAEAGATSPDARLGFAAPAWGGSATPDNGAAQAAAAAAARAAAFLNSSRENLQELLQPPTSPGRPLGRYACVCVCICMGACMRVRVRAYV